MEGFILSGSRRSGVLLHISSLPGGWGIGDLGKEARRFADFLHGAGFSIWQVLPLTPVLAAFGDSPYSSPSAFAGNKLLISPEELCKEGLITKEEAECFVLPSERKADFVRAAACRKELLAKSWHRFSTHPKEFAELHEAFEKFRSAEESWLRDYALFSVLKERNGNACWTDWAHSLAFREPEALKKFTEQNREAIDLTEFTQFIFFRQLTALSEYCAGLGITMMGDVPIYVAWDSADVWSHPYLFDLNDDGRPRCVSGVPPDYFSSTGQRWGNPLYQWEKMRDEGFRWWRSRLAHTRRYCGLMRIDHFRGLCAYWSIPASEKTAQHGHWRPALGRDLLNAFSRDCTAGSQMPLVAEDLGIITDDVRQLMKDFSLPGMKVLMFAFSGRVFDNPYVPHNITKRSVVYTGTHDNDTAAGWWTKTSSEHERKNFAAYTGQTVTRDNVNHIMVQMALASPADTAIIPAQDILALDSSCRMNVPSVAKGNWGWRMLPKELELLLSDSYNFPVPLAELNRIYGRSKDD